MMPTYIFEKIYILHDYSLFPNFIFGDTCSGRALFSSPPPRVAKAEKSGFSGCGGAGMRI